VTVLARSDAALDAAYATLVEALGFGGLREPSSSSSSSSSPSHASPPLLLRGPRRSATVSLDGRTALELVTVPQVPWAWVDREDRPPQLLRLLSVNVADNEGGHLAAPWGWESEVAAAVGSGAGATRVLSFLSSVGLGAFTSVPHVGPFIVHGGGGWRGEQRPATTQPSQPTPPPAAASLVEIVLGLGEGKGFAAGESMLSGLGAARHAAFPSVWRLPQTLSPTPHSPSLRLLPGRYSALVVAILGGADARAAYLSRAVESGAAVAHGYGERRGTALSGQAALRHPSLHGLDLRLAAGSAAGAAAVPLPCFNEPPEAMEDEVDPRLNPGADSPGKQQSLGCPSVVGMEVASTLRMRLGRGQLR
jgi:hypothetical protein